MGDRHALVIASQCRRLRPLSFLPQVGSDLCRVLTDGRRGGWAPALDHGALIVDPGVDEVRHRVEQAFERAKRAGGVLLLAFIGHGEMGANEDFWFLPVDAGPLVPRSAFPLVSELGSLRALHAGVRVVVLVDTCASGAATQKAAADWARLHHEDFEVLAATSDDLAYDGCFSRTLVSTLDEGHPTLASDVIRCSDMVDVLRSACPDQEPHHLSWRGDKSLRLGLNATYLTPLGYMLGVQDWAKASVLTESLQPTAALRDLVALDSRCVAITGPFGSGKSTLVAALARYDRTEDVVPEGFLHGLVFLDGTMDAESVAERLSQQFTKRVPGFVEELDALHRVPEARWSRRNAFERLVLEPLRRLSVRRPVRMVLDGVDLLSPDTARQIEQVLLTLAREESLAHVRVLVTRQLELERPPVGLPPDALEFPLSRASDEEIAGYLARRGIADHDVPELVSHISGNWQVAHVLAGLAQQGEVAVASLPTDLGQGYTDVLQTAAERLGPERREHLSTVLSVLAVSGAAPVLPSRLLLEATRQMGGPATRADLDAVLLALRGHVVRGLPGSDDETVGLFHATFIGHLREGAGTVVEVDLPAAHRAVADALRELAPSTSDDGEDPLHRYAETAEADHLWAVGEHEASFTSMLARAARLPDQNANRWRRWLSRAEADGSVDAVLRLRARRELIRSVAGRGDYRNAVDLGRALLREVQADPGPANELALRVEQDLAADLAATGRFTESLECYQHVLDRLQRDGDSDGPDALACRWRAAALLGWAGDIDRSLDALSTTIPQLVARVGPDDPQTLIARSAQGVALALKGRDGEAADVLAEVVPGLSRVLGSDHPETLWARCSHAFVHGVTGDVEEARAELETILPLLRSAFGPHHPVSLIAEYYRIFAQGTSGEIQPAVEQLESVIPKLAAVLGEDHLHTLIARGVHAFLLGYSGGYRRALDVYHPLLAQMERILGPQHWQTLICRSHMLLFQGRAHAGAGAVDQLLGEVVPQLEKVLGPMHPQTLLARTSAAYLSAFTGDPGRALQAYDKVLADQREQLGPDHVQTLVAERNRVWLLLYSGAVLPALLHSRRVLPRLEKTLGRDHLHTLVARDTHEFIRTLLGGAQLAARRLPRIVSALESQVGRDNPYTLIATAHLAIVLGWAGDIQESRATFEELVPRLQRFLGAEHPQTLLARCNYAAMLVLHDRPLALTVYQDVLPRLERALGNDHPLCLVHRGQQALVTLIEGHPVRAAGLAGEVGMASAKRVVRQPGRALRRVHLIADAARRAIPGTRRPAISG